jgi:hypothetical protein
VKAESSCRFLADLGFGLRGADCDQSFLSKLGNGATFFLASKWWVVALAGGVTGGVSVAALAVYGYLFNCSRFDLAPIRKMDED